MSGQGKAVSLKGQKKHSDRLKRMSGGGIVAAAGRVVFVGSDMIRTEAFRSISAGSISGKNHVASAPGESPNRDLGDLQAGFTNDQTGPVSAEFRSSAPHSRPLEFGTSKMEPRPHVRPARDKMAPKIRKLFAREIDKLVKGSG